jgi:hypothetical protein
MSGDSQASFSKSVRSEIRSKYGLRCAICLDYLPEVGTQSAYLIDSTSVGAEQMRMNETTFQSDTKHAVFFSFLRQ